MSIIAILVASIASMIIGMFWYSQAGFGKSWMKETGMTKKKMKKMAISPVQAMTLGFLATVLTAYILAKVLFMTPLTGTMGGLQLGFWIWLGFVATTQLGVVLWEGKTVKLFTINTFYSLVNLLVIGAIIGAMA